MERDSLGRGTGLFEPRTCVNTVRACIYVIWGDCIEQEMRHSEMKKTGESTGSVYKKGYFSC